MYQFTTKLESFSRGYLSCKHPSYAMKVASGMLLAAQDTPITFDLEKGLVYTISQDAVVMKGSLNIVCDEEKFAQLIREHPEDAEDLKYIQAQMLPVSPERNNRRSCSEEQLDLNVARYMWGGGWIGHAVPNFADIALYGTDHFRAKIQNYRAQNPGKDDFYDSLCMTLDELEILGQRILVEAEALLAQTQDPDHRKKLEAIAETFRIAPKAPCQDFVQGVIVFAWIFRYDGNDSPGHFDQYMYPLWKVTDPALRRQYLEAIWNMFYATRAWNLCISGSDENWNDLSNELTYEVLDVAAKYGYNTPNLTMRCHRNTPESLLRAAYKTISTGCGMPVLYNDEAVCPALERLGIPPCDSHLYVMNGCNQIDIQGKSHMGLEDGEIVLPAALKFVLYNGIDYQTGKDMALHTGDPRDFESYEDFYAAFLIQLDNLARVTCEMSNNSQAGYARRSANPIRSLLIEGCIEKGKDYKNSGPLYGHGQILLQGIAEVADSLAVIKKYVYEEKRFTMDQLIRALDADFEGYEDLYNTVRNTELKYGNDIDYVDSIAADVVNFVNRLLTTLPTYRGGFYSGGCSPFTRTPYYAVAIGALPNGKRQGSTILADSIGATPGFDVNGPTALLSSCAKIDHSLPGSGFSLNLKFDKPLFLSQAGAEAFIALSKTYFGQGGQMLTYTLVSGDELRDAQLHPENHRNLIVRVGGYSEYFVNLNPELQNNVIARTCHTL